MAAILLTPPALEPLTLAEAKAYLRVEHADDDALLASLITSARGQVEGRTRRALITQSWRVILHAWPAQGRLTLPLAPAREVLAARVYDADNVAHAIDAEVFVVDLASAPGVISFPSWAVTAPGRPLAGIELDVAFGYGDAAADVPEPLRHAVRLLLAQAYDNRGFAESAAPVSLDALIAPYKALTL